MKIPSNRDDLLIEKFLIQELSLIFLLKEKNVWEKLKKNYNFILKQKYIQYLNYSTINFDSNIPSIFTYAIEIENSTNQNSPLWIQNKLLNFGTKPCENKNDICNLVILEWGQNLNLSTQISENLENSSTYKIESLNKNENFYDSHGKNYELKPGTIVLKKNSNEIISVFGILNTSVKNGNTFLLEGTFYDINEEKLKSTFNKDQFLQKLYRKMFLENFRFSFQRILTLLEIIYFSEIKSKKFITKTKKINLESVKLICFKKNSLKVFLNLDTIDEKILQKGGFEIVCKTVNEFFLKIPSFRRDLTREIDIIEEYSRFIGYSNFQEILPKKFQNNSTLKTSIFLKQFFLNYGFNEILTNPIRDNSENEAFSIKINNPLTKELSSLRTTLIPKLIETFNNNARISSTFNNFFEMGRVFKKFNKQIIEEDKFTAIFTIPKNFSTNNYSDWFVAIGFLENILSNFGYETIKKEKINPNIKFFHKTRSILLKENNKILGIFGEINPQYLNNVTNKISVYIFELNLTYFKNYKLYSGLKNYKEYSIYPSIKKDLSFLIEKESNFLALKIFIEKNLNSLKSIQFFDIYINEKFNNLVNIAIRLEFQSNTYTLTNDFIEKEIEKVKSLLFEKFQVQFRN
uniref:phenylalanine--tRNA ligase n=1 Tax=Synura uvella TaxID=52557 RepID=A0A3G2QZQ5_9STRA|nr:phenylalanyl tRNA synthetase beta subunit [Synura uvella]AYO28371.1 phenylalanyl tRNA synthetase beta subunit [Synura uvella]